MYPQSRVHSSQANYVHSTTTPTVKITKKSNSRNANSALGHSHYLNKTEQTLNAYSNLESTASQPYGSTQGRQLGGGSSSFHNSRAKLH